MIVPLSELHETGDPSRIYFVVLDREISLHSPPTALSWSSTQIGIWASRGQVIAVQDAHSIPGVDTTRVEVVSFHQASLVKPDLSGIVLQQRKSKNGILISTLERKTLSIVLKRRREAILLPESAQLDLTAEQFMEGRMTLTQLMGFQAGNAIVGLNAQMDEAGLVELVIVPRGALFQAVKRRPLPQG